MKQGLPPLSSRRTKAKHKEGNGGCSQTMSAEPSETRKLSLSALTGLTQEGPTQICEGHGWNLEGIVKVLQPDSSR